MAKIECIAVEYKVTISPMEFDVIEHDVWFDLQEIVGQLGAWGAEYSENHITLKASSHDKAVEVCTKLLEKIRNCL